MTEPSVALITTTINVPEVLKLYRECDETVRFFVAGDLKTPGATGDLVNSIPNARYIVPDAQKRWASSELVGWNCIQRRNFALLEALEWGADIIISIDDDNLPLHINYFDSIVSKFSYPHSGLAAVGHNYWFDAGQLLRPISKHRGVPFGVNSDFSIKPITQAPVGAVAGLCLGDPDIDAVTRMAVGPEVHGVSELARSGLVVDPSTWTVFNSQNTAFLREFAPCMFMLPHCGRYDDIYASLITQWAMRHAGYHVHFGEPFVWQSRNKHNLHADLRAEIDGMENVARFAKFLENLGPSDLKALYALLGGMDYISKATQAAAAAWIEDVEIAMGMKS